MTLAAYQSAFARMVLSPTLCVRARTEGEAALPAADLSAAERTRLVHIARQRGMRITCILARANRLSALVGALPLTCTLLKPDLNALLDRYWDERPMESLQALPAGLLFGSFLTTAIAEGRVTRRHAADVLRFELERLSLQRAAHAGPCAADDGTLVRRVHFAGNPLPLFVALAEGLPVPEVLTGGPITLLLDFRHDPPRTSVTGAHPLVTPTLVAQD
jgi:hypothetical protein